MEGDSAGAVEATRFTPRARVKLDGLLNKLLRGPKGVDAEVALLDADQLRVVKAILKRCGPASIDFMYEVLQQRGFSPNNSRSRLMALYLLRDILDRSQYLRNKVFGGDVIAVVKQIVELQGMSSLPVPQAFARVLHSKALQCLRKWRDTYGHQYPKLKIAAKFLDAYLPAVADSSLTLSIRQREEAAREARAQRILRARFENICEVMMIGDDQGEEVLEIMANNDQMRQHLELLTPSVFNKLALAHSSSSTAGIQGQRSEETANDDDDFSDIEWDSDEEEADSRAGPSSSSRQMFIDNATDELYTLNHIPNDYELVLQVPVGRGTTKSLIKQHAPNADKTAPSAESLLVEAIADCMKLAQRVHIPRLKTWIRILSRVELDDPFRRSKRGKLLKLALQMRNDLRALLIQCEDLGILRVVEKNPPEETFDKLFTEPSTQTKPDQATPGHPPSKAKNRSKRKTHPITIGTLSSKKPKKPFNPFARRR